MNKQIEALKMAIEAMQSAYSSHGKILTSYPAQDAWMFHGCDAKLSKSIQACKEALAEAEKQEPYAWEINHLDATSPPPYIVKHNPFYKNDSNTKVTPLYTHPATWQSLSDDDISEILNKHGFDNVEMAGCHIDIVLLIRDTEQALKEKNHG